MANKENAIELFGRIVEHASVQKIQELTRDNKKYAPVIILNANNNDTVDYYFVTDSTKSVCTIKNRTGELFERFDNAWIEYRINPASGILTKGGYNSNNNNCAGNGYTIVDGNGNKMPQQPYLQFVGVDVINDVDNNTTIVKQSIQQPIPQPIPPPTLSLESGEFFLSITVDVIRPENFPDMTVFYFLNGNYSQPFVFAGTPFTVTHTTTVALFGMVGTQMTGLVTYEFIIEQPHFIDNMKFSDSVMTVNADSVAFSFKNVMKVGLSDEFTVGDDVGLTDAINLSFI